MAHSHLYLADIAKQMKDASAFRLHVDAAAAILGDFERKGLFSGDQLVAKLRDWLAALQKQQR